MCGSQRNVRKPWLSKINQNLDTGIKRKRKKKALTRPYLNERPNKRPQITRDLKILIKG